jgi:hypothetical protein
MKRQTPDNMDFSNPKSSKMLEVHDVVIKTSEGKLYANACMLVRVEFFYNLLTANIEKTDGRIVLEFELPTIILETVLLHIYEENTLTESLITVMLDSPEILDQFLEFIHGKLISSILPFLMTVLKTRTEPFSDVYPIIRKHSNYGTTEFFRNGQINTLEDVFFSAYGKLDNQTCKIAYSTEADVQFVISRLNDKPVCLNTWCQVLFAMDYQLVSDNFHLITCFGNAKQVLTCMLKFDICTTNPELSRKCIELARSKLIGGKSSASKLPKRWM